MTRLLRFQKNVSTIRIIDKGRKKKNNKNTIMDNENVDTTGN